MAARYTVNGQEMSEEEFQRFQQENGFWNFGNHSRQRRWDHKPHIYQGYKDVAPNRWQEISIDDLKHDVNKSPKFLKKIYYVQSINREYTINEFPVVCIFYDHVNDKFLYGKPNGLIEERNCFETKDEAYNAILELEDKKRGDHYLLGYSGEVLMKYTL